jgi:hypothetical protein
MFFTKPTVTLPKITAPTAAEICVKSNPSPQAQALLTPEMTPAEYFQALEKNKLPVDSVNFLANGLPAKDSICWACQGANVTAPKLSGPEAEALKLTQAWLKNPSAGALASVQSSLNQVDFTGPGSWAAQAAAWANAPAAPAVPGVPVVNLTAAAVAGAIMLAAGLNTGPAMPAVPKPKLEVPNAPLSPELLLQLQKPQVPPVPVIVDQLKLVKPLAPFLELGKGVASGTVTCC